MSESTMPEITDAELLGRYAREAIELGRFRMAGALTQLAQRAADYDARMARAAAEFRAGMANIDRGEQLRLVPVLGATRTEHALTPADTFHMRGDGRLQQTNPPVSPAPNQLTDTVVTSAGSHAPSTCAAQLPDGMCDGLISWSDGFSGSRSGWYHLDQTITGHGAVPTLQAANQLAANRPGVTRTDLRVADWVNGAE